MKTLNFGAILFLIAFTFSHCQSNSTENGSDSTKVQNEKPKNKMGYLGKWKEVDGDYYFTLEAREDGNVYFLLKDQTDPGNLFVCELKNSKGRNRKDEMVDIITILPKYKNGETLRSLFYDPGEDAISTETYKRNYYERR